MEEERGEMDRRTFLCGSVGAWAAALGLAACGSRDADGGSAVPGGEDVIVSDAEARWEAPARITCAGDSITWGDGVADTRDTDSYPAQLQALLAAEGYGTVCDNFGYNGACCLSRGKNPYIIVQPYRDSLSQCGDMVILMLGTNDAVSVVWDRDAYLRELGDFVDDYQALDAAPQVVLMVPPDLSRTTFGAAYSDAKFDEMQQAVRDLAADRGLVCVDLEPVFAGHEGEWLADGVHPNREGNARIAQTVYAALSGADTV